MPCFYLIQGYRKKSGGFTQNRGESYHDLPMQIPCGRCMGCRVQRAAAWGTRCVHEAQMHTENSFITLTYDDQHLPSPPTLALREIQLFIKKLRKKYQPKKIRFFSSGEYGSIHKTERPHYHILLFGHDFPDKIHSRTDRDIKSYHSKILDEIWGKGRTEISDLNFKTANYTAQYCLKKLWDNRDNNAYTRTDEWGEIYELKPPFGTMSTKPGV